MKITDYLDELDQAHAAATAGPWQHWPDYPASVLDVHGDAVAEVETSTADNTLIVAAVNALPKLTAALRAVLDLATDLPAADFWHTNAIRDAVAGPFGGAA